MPLDFEVVFLIAVISKIESIGVGRQEEGGEGVGRWGAESRLKQTFGHAMQPRYWHNSKGRPGLLFKVV